MNVSAENTQIPLNMRLNDDATFDNFFIAKGNEEIVNAIKVMIVEWNEPFIFVWGDSGSGLSHLLQAACFELERVEKKVQYLPLSELAGFEPEQLLESLENLDFLCLDDLHQVIGKLGWDEALFHLYNRLMQNNCRLLVSADCAPKGLRSMLPDLFSRMSNAVVYRLNSLTDVEKYRALQKRAANRGLELNDEVAQFILNHASREMSDLIEHLERLDRHSLLVQRKLTIPFVKEVLGW